MKNDLLPVKEWITPEWPIYKCRECGTQIEKSSRNALYTVFSVVIVIAVAQFLGGLVGYFLSGGSESTGDIVGWVTTVVGLLWLAFRPMRLVERGGYAK